MIMKKTFLIFLLVFLASFVDAAMPVFRNMFTTNVPGAYVRGNAVFGTGAAGSYTFNGQQLLYVDAAGGVDFMISTNVYGTGTPLFIVRNGTVGIGSDVNPSYSLYSGGQVYGLALVSGNFITSESGIYNFSSSQYPILRRDGLGFRFTPGAGATNLMRWDGTNGVAQSVINTNGWFGINTNSPKAALDVHGSVLSTNFTLKVPQWNDERIPLGALSSPSATPGRVAFIGGVSVYGFDKASTEQLDFELQLPHGISTNEAYGIHIHLHWTGTTALTAGTSNVVWGLEYALAKVGSTFPAVTITNRITNTLNSVRFHEYSEFALITNGFGESTVIVGRMFREGGNAADTYDGDALGLSLDCHYPMIRMGSFNEDGDY